MPKILGIKIQNIQRLVDNLDLFDLHETM